MASLLERAIRGERDALLRDDDAARERLLRAWQLGKARIAARIAELAPDLADDPHPTDVARMARLRRLSALVDDEVIRLGATVVADATARQRDLAGAAAAGARRIAEAQRPGIGADWAALPREATEEMVGVLGDGSPVADAVGRRFGAFAAQAKDELLAGIVEGIGPRQLAARLSALGDGFVARHVLTLARTEPLRAARAASLRTMAANADVLAGWVWTATLSPRTCLACLAMHNTRHPLSEAFFASHPACRCTPTPWVKGTPESDFGQTGEQWFRAQPRAKQREQMGAAAWEAWRRGEVAFGDFLGERDDPVWGRSVYERPLRDVLAGRRPDRRAA